MKSPNSVTFYLKKTSKEAQWIYVSTEEHIYKRLWNTETGCWEKNWQFVL